MLCATVDYFWSRTQCNTRSKHSYRSALRWTYVSVVGKSKENVVIFKIAIYYPMKVKLYDISSFWLIFSIRCRIHAYNLPINVYRQVALMAQWITSLSIKRDRILPLWARIVFVIIACFSCLTARLCWFTFALWTDNSSEKDKGIAVVVKLLVYIIST